MVKKSDFSDGKGMKTYDFLKIQSLCELMQNESAQNIEKGKQELK